VTIERRPLWDRFWAKVRFTGACWEWTGSTTPGGYGHIGAGGHDGQTLLAHRVAYQLLVGPISTGLTLDHLCRNRRCVNPDHLEPVTGRENTTRGRVPGGALYEKGMHYRSRWTHCPRGHEFTEANTSLKGGRRRCRECARIRNNKYNAARRQQECMN